MVIFVVGKDLSQSSTLFDPADGAAGPDFAAAFRDTRVSGYRYKFMLTFTFSPFYVQFKKKRKKSCQTV